MATEGFVGSNESGLTSASAVSIFGISDATMRHNSLLEHIDIDDTTKEASHHSTKFDNSKKHLISPLIQQVCFIEGSRGV